MKKNILIIALFTAALMLSMPCISAVNYNEVEHKNIDNILSKIKTKSDTENKFNLETLVLKLLGIIMLISYINLLASGSFLVGIVIFPILGLISGLFWSEPIERMKAGIEMVIIFNIAAPIIGLTYLLYNGTEAEIKEYLKTIDIVNRYITLGVYFFGLERWLDPEITA